MELISQDDWDSLNAYSDGELPAAEAHLLETRLQTEPALQNALEQIQGVGSALKALRPEAGSAPAQSRKSMWSYRYIAIAASIALVLVFAGQSFWGHKTILSPSDLHQAFLQQSFNVSQADIQRVNITSDVPDLATANLALVADVTEGNATRALHYAGRNGCRLTLTIAKVDLPNVKATPELLLASWSVTSVHYTLLATGMDGNRFAAITEFVRVYSEQQNRPATIMAMRDATETAVPCTIG
jgi:hypothetical protein